MTNDNEPLNEFEALHQYHSAVDGMANALYGVFLLFKKNNVPLTVEQVVELRKYWGEYNRGIDVLHAHVLAYNEGKHEGRVTFDKMILQAVDAQRARLSAELSELRKLFPPEGVPDFI